MDFYDREPFGKDWENWLMAVPLKYFADAHSKKGTNNDISDFFYEDEQSQVERKERETAQLIDFFDTYKPKR